MRMVPDRHGHRCRGCGRKFDEPGYREPDHNLPRPDGGPNGYARPCGAVRPLQHTPRQHLYAFMAAQGKQKQGMYAVKDAVFGRLIKYIIPRFSPTSSVCAPTLRRSAARACPAGEAGRDKAPFGTSGSRARNPGGHHRLFHRRGATDGTGHPAPGMKCVKRIGRLEPAFKGVPVCAFQGVTDHHLFFGC